MATRRQDNLRGVFGSALASGKQREKQRAQEQQRAGTYKSSTGVEGVPGQLIDSLFKLGRRNYDAKPTPIRSVGMGPRTIAQNALGKRSIDTDSPHALGSIAQNALGSSPRGGIPSAGEQVQRNADLLRPDAGDVIRRHAGILEEREQQGGFGGDAGGGGGGGGMGMMDMFRQLQQQQQARQEAMRRQLGSSYDRQIEAVRGQGPIMRGLAEEAQGNIGGFFDYAAEAAEGGRAPIQSAYETAGSNVDAAYGQATEQVQGLPSVYTELAAEAGGEGARSGVAQRVAAAAAPFEASLASGQAAVQGNLSQSQAAGEQYLSQLASAAPSEAAMAQSGVEGALQQQLQDIQMQAAQLEGAKQRALMQAASDTSGDVFDRMMDLQQLQMDRERHNMALKQGEMGLKQSQLGMEQDRLEMQQSLQGGQDPMAQLDPLEQMRLRKMQQEQSPLGQGGRQGANMVQQRLAQGDSGQSQVIEAIKPIVQPILSGPSQSAEQRYQEMLGAVEETFGSGGVSPEIDQWLQLMAGLYD